MTDMNVLGIIKPMKISIITVCRNSVGTIADAMESVAKQRTGVEEVGNVERVEAVEKVEKVDLV